VRARHARRCRWTASARTIRDEAGVIARFGVAPASIPDYLALVGDAADGYPGLPGWGAKSAAAVLARFHHLEAIPDDWRTWSVNAANPARLARTLASERQQAMLFRRLATLRTDVDVGSVNDLQWQGPTAGVRAPRGAPRCRAEGTLSARRHSQIRLKRT